VRKLIAAFKVSLDLKFQGPGDYADWVDAWSDDYGLTPEIDACVLGGDMYRGYEGYWSAMMANPTAPSPMTGTVATPAELAWAEAIPSLPHYVLTRSDLAPAWPNARILRSTDDVAALKAGRGRAIYAMGGGRAFNALLDARLVDELRLIVHPVLAGGSHDLFAARDERRACRLARLRELDGGRVRLDYAFEGRRVAGESSTAADAPRD
jgi:dihydrofolate reductase